MGFLGFFLIGCLLMVLFILGVVCACCWNEGLWCWQYNFGDSMGETLYNFNKNTNKAWNNFWKYFGNN